jgi:hypothetical protein
MERGPGADRARRVARAVRQQLPLLGFLAVMVVYYVFQESAGRWTDWATWTVFNDPQAEGFRLGHLYLPEPPSRALLALRDPLNPVHMTLWRWDRSYYKGHFYLYWGLVPALMLAGVKAMFQIRRVVTDDVIVFVFFLGRLLAGTLLIRALARRVTPRPASWAVGLAMALYALAHPTPYLLARGAVYEAAIIAGACFMVSGLGLALRGIFATAPGPAVRWLTAASVCFGLAGGSRISLLPAVVLLVGFTALARWRIDGGDRGRLVRVGLAACGPAAALTLAHLVLNKLRYQAWSEFGARYQMGNPLRAGWRFVIPNLFAYLFCPPTQRCTFPFLFGLWNTTHPLAPGWLPWPADYHADEPTSGLLVVAVFAWLAPAGILFAIIRRLTRANPAASPGPARELLWRWRWVYGALALYTSASVIPLLSLSAATMRYEADFASGLLLIAILGGWRLLSAPASRAGRAALSALYLTLAVTTIAASVLLGFTGYFEHFKRHNPLLLHRIESRFSVCRRP